MKTSDFDYNLPKELIANSHIEPRDHSRLFVFDRLDGSVRHEHFYDIVDFLTADDVLVFNDTKVFKARIFGSKKTGGKIEFLLVHPVDDIKWETLIKGKIAEGDEVFFEDGLVAQLISKEKDGTCVVNFNKTSGEIFQYLEEKGEMPLPPYIEKNHESRIMSQEGESDFYQTKYAKNIGSVAAPTAGFHFTPELIEKIKAKGIKILHITLHVGPGTFRPVKTDDISEHQMHEEFFEVGKDVWDEILDAKKNGKRIVVVGTTTCRVLETLAGNNKFQITNNKQISNSKFQISNDSHIHDSRFQILDSKIVGSTKIFIYPPYKFQIVDALITNFHLPKSTLLMLVSAFLGSGKNGLLSEASAKDSVETIKKLYNIAVGEKCRFFSFGDSMYIK